MVMTCDAASGAVLDRNSLHVVVDGNVNNVLLEQATSALGPWTTASTWEPGTPAAEPNPGVADQIVHGLAHNTTYFFRFTDIGTNGQVVCGPYTTPDYPTLACSTPTALGTTTASVGPAVTGAPNTGFINDGNVDQVTLRWGTTPGGPYPNVVGPQAPPATQFNLTGLPAGTTIYYKTESAEVVDQGTPAVPHVYATSPECSFKTLQPSGGSMAVKCVSLIKACRLRITKLDVCGKPVTGPKSVINSDGFIKVTAKAVIEAGTEYKQKNACGAYCINETDCDILTRYDLAIDLCNVDPDAIAIMTSQREITNVAGDTVGYAIGSTIDCDAGFSLEVWQKPAGGDACVGGVQEWWYTAFPWIDSGTTGDIVMENAPFTFTVNSKTKGIKRADQWCTGNLGPFSVVPAGQGLKVDEHVIAFLTEVQPPAATCGAQAYAGCP